MPEPLSTPSELLQAAREMADTGRPVLARLLAEEAADRTEDSAEAVRILHEFTGRSLRHRQEN